MDEWTTSPGRTDRDRAPKGETLCEFELDRTDPERGTTVVGYDPEVDPLSIAVPTLVGHCKQVDPCSLPPLYDVIDAEALGGLLGDGDASKLFVTFRYAGYTVSVGEGGLSVRPEE